MQIIKHRKIFFFISLLLIAGSAFSLIFYGLNLGIDFTGGSLLEVEYKGERPANNEILEKLEELDLGQINLQQADKSSLILRLKDIDEKTHQDILEHLDRNKIEEKRFESIGPAIGQELKRKAMWAILIALLAIIVYIAYSFRKVSYPVQSWQYGLVAIAALFHDIFITLGVFSFLGYFQQIEIGLPFIAALLTILGYSVNNSIVIFDRTRENLLTNSQDDFEEIANESVNQSLSRCLNTALTTLLVLLAIFFMGGESIKYFALALIIGISIGTYSSVFATNSLIVSWYKRK